VTVLPRLTMTGGRAELHFRPLADPTAMREIRCLRAVNASPTPAVLAFQDKAIAKSQNAST
jgi:hypothetical protein